jgi:hypothetical protein
MYAIRFVHLQATGQYRSIDAAKSRGSLFQLNTRSLRPPSKRPLRCSQHQLHAVFDSLQHWSVRPCLQIDAAAQCLVNSLQPCPLFRRLQCCHSGDLPNARSLRDSIECSVSREMPPICVGRRSDGQPGIVTSLPTLQLGAASTIPLPGVRDLRQLA